MVLQKRWSFGIGTIFSFIIVYFIYLYSREKGWALLAFISKGYLLIVGGLMALSVLAILLVILLSLLMMLAAYISLKSSNAKFKNKNNNKKDAYIEAEYRIKE